MAKKKSKSKLKTPKTAAIIKPSILNEVNTEVIAAVINTVGQSSLKVCRLCESKDGPFHNIFDAEKVTAKKIEELMPFWVAENDDLPHKICFRCSAKVEELYEFVQKCTGTQENLRKALGKKEPLPVKKKERDIWEQKLNKTNMSNDDICQALIKKAMESITGFSKHLSSREIEEGRQGTSSSKVVEVNSEFVKQDESINETDDNVTLNEIKTGKRDDNSNTRLSRSSQVVSNQNQNYVQPRQTRFGASKQPTNSDIPANVDLNVDTKDLNTVSNKSYEHNNKKDNNETSYNSTVNSKPFDIMDHVSMIKVNGVGTLFQCSLCNRNFLKKGVVMSHGCAKTGVPKIDVSNMYMPPEPPKVNTVKYINTRIGADSKNVTNLETTSSTENEAVKKKVKKKIGPASKIGRRIENSNTVKDTQESSNETTEIHSILPNTSPETTKIQAPVSFLSIPNLTSRYKIVCGPNNSLSLIEDKVETDSVSICSNSMSDSTVDKRRKSQSLEVIDLAESPVENKAKNTTKNSKKSIISSRAATRPASNSTIENHQADQPSGAQPYPVGLFQTVPHHSSSFGQTSHSVQVPFTTPAIKKQSYTVVQTGNPSKLLISTKPQQKVDDVSKKRVRKTKQVAKINNSPEEPFSVILEDTSPPKDTRFFTFINVDPLLQPSYVLPTDNIIQESQISTSTPIAKNGIESSKEKEKDKDKYTCNMCGEKFNREKKLKAHIYTHYSVQDEDNSQDERPKKRTRR